MKWFNLQRSTGLKKLTVISKRLDRKNYFSLQLKGYLFLRELEPLKESSNSENESFTQSLSLLLSKLWLHLQKLKNKPKFSFKNTRRSLLFVGGSLPCFKTLSGKHLLKIGKMKKRRLNNNQTLKTQSSNANLTRQLRNLSRSIRLLLIKN